MVVFFDLAGTLITEHREDEFGERKVRKLREGLDTGLPILIQNGFKVACTTGSSKSDAEQSLSDQGVRSLFMGIFGNETVSQNSIYKSYAGAATFIDEDPANLMHTGIVIGDSEYDVPADVDGMVTVQINSFNPNNIYLTEVILFLANQPDPNGGTSTSFHDNFERLYSMVEEDAVQRRIVDMQVSDGKQLRLLLEYRQYDGVDRQVITTSVVKVLGSSI